MDGGRLRRVERAANTARVASTLADAGIGSIHPEIAAPGIKMGAQFLGVRSEGDVAEVECFLEE